MAEDEAPGPSGTECPSCGIVVALGYPRCPKCHAAMPSAERAGGGRAQAPGTRSGGTSVADEGGGMGMLLAAVGILAVAGGAAVLLLRGNGEEVAKPEAAKATAEEPTSAVTADDIPGQPTVDRVGHDEDHAAFGDVEGRARREGLAGVIDSELNGLRLWSSVDVDGPILEISSGYCAEQGMRVALGEHAEDLASSGFELVRCRERHGPLVFELSVAELRGGAAPAEAIVDAAAG